MEGASLGPPVCPADVAPLRGGTREGITLRSGQVAALRLNGDTAPIVLSLLAWSRRFIAAFIALGLLAVGWSFSGLHFEGRRVLINTEPVWPAVVVGTCIAVVAVALGLRQLAR